MVSAFKSTELQNEVKTRQHKFRHKSMERRELEIPYVAIYSVLNIKEIKLVTCTQIGKKVTFTFSKTGTLTSEQIQF
jgi:antirestriction protein ArdC